MNGHKWIDTTGGPIVILPINKVKDWSGSCSIQSIVTKKIIEAYDFLDPNETDYGKACQVENYIDTLDFGEDKAIVLGDVPLQTTNLKYNVTDILIIRWFYAENEESVNSHLQTTKINEIKNWSLDFILNVSVSDYLMFDSSEIGFMADEKDWLSFSLEIGKYEISTCEYKPDDETFLILHKFKKI